ncbi:sodium/calcium exchanger 1-like, partial [Rhagoletis pomonella]|uniref:sodium/calcium exchanger 1-like n=1 Tax=Rhagoletis pomonella TaxID=28610 RepID=UPI001782DF6A
TPKSANALSDGDPRNDTLELIVLSAWYLTVARELFCVHAYAQEKTNSPGVTQWNITPKSITPSPLADSEPSIAKPTTAVPPPDDLNLKQMVNPISSTTQPEATVPPQNESNERNSINPFFRSDFDEGIIRCKDGLILKSWRPLEGVSKTERIKRGIIYFLAMCYLFIGVAIVSNRFMESIEVITSSEKRVTVLNKNGQKETISVRVWSQTVANLTLMALGSSAPEIFLSIIEMFQKNFEAGDLGPGTIVGSAAYNLFIIIAICMVVIPKGQVRKIRNFRVFVVTSVWSTFAYIWLCLIVKYISPGVIDIWEGLLTFIFFPILVYHAYITERRLFCPKCYKQSYETNQRGIVVGKVESAEQGKDPVRTSIKDLVESPEMREFEETRRDYIIKLKELRRRYPEYDLEIIQAMAQEQLIKDSRKSRAFYRVHTGRRLTGGPGVLNRALYFATMEISERKAEARMQGEEDEELYDDFETCIYFEHGHYTVMESVGDVELHVIRGGNLKHLTKVEYSTEDGTAKAGTDYVAMRGVLEFAPGIELQTIKIRIIDDDVFEEDEHFYVHLKNPSTEAVLVAPKVATIMILDDDHCGIFGFKETQHQIPETVKIYEIFVKRYSGALGRVIVPYYTKEKTAKSGKEYVDVSGILVFEHGVVEQIIEVQIIDEQSFEKDVVFEVYLGQPRIAE